MNQAKEFHAHFHYISCQIRLQYQYFVSKRLQVATSNMVPSASLFTFLHDLPLLGCDCLEFFANNPKIKLSKL